MKRLLLLLLLLAVPFPATAHADGCPPISCGTTSTTVPAGKTLLILSNGRYGPAKGIDLQTGRVRFSLPYGLVSADGLTYVAGARAKAARTAVARFDAMTGRMRGGWSRPGRWTVSGVSADGRRVVLTEYTKAPSMRVALFDGHRRTAKFALAGNYELEALSPGARRVFFIHWRRYGYDLKRYDVRTRRLEPTPLADPGEKMRGSPLGAVASRDGHWLLTLYIEADGGSFVHALDLRTGVGHCIDLPLVGDFGSVGATALTLSPDQKRLYLASPLLGRLTTVDLRRLRVARVNRFRPSSPNDFDAGVAPSAAVTPNGRVLAFSGERRLWLYDAAFAIVRPAIRTTDMIAGLGFSPDGRRVLTVPSRGRASAFDAATGRRLG
jgi:hypothetical protein